MILQENFKALLLSMGFIRAGNIYTHQPNGHLIQVDFDSKLLLYPKDVALEGQFTTNFGSNENFVVFECVHRLLELGYQPNQITLEPKWKVGHGASGGRADIQIKNNDGDVFAIIECKTAGKEFDDAWEYMQLYPSQLFSYAQQERTTEVLCLYASDWNGSTVVREYHAFSIRDNESLIKDDSLTYAKADTHAALFEAWKQTYSGETTSLGLFEDGSAPLLFGKKNYSITDLQAIALSDIQKKYHRFASILRKHNVSGRENAFDKLVNLFLCKVVDEKENPTNLRFYWKGLANDTNMQLQDRLQSLYQQGMKRFLKEDVTYISQQQIDEAFRFLDPKDPDATKKVIEEYFIRLKFFTNNDFAFIEVHNEALFKKNAAVLLEIIEMLQGIRLVGDEEGHTNQFLGDMFEGFLDAGVKQSEGQFFTPMPIVKAIMSSLPLAQIVAHSDEPPKAIDYACGAGHFLTELAQKLKPHIAAFKPAANIRDYYSAITGIEKEYRLSKVAKVSAFMYGQDDINIIHADALAQNGQVAEGTYQILVANPPYSVKGFLDTLLKQDRNAYELFRNIDAKGTGRNNAIETFFIERAAQLLAPGGVAAIILPSSILSNDGSQYQKTREILLRRFHIKAIAELGSGTFGKTGTNTVTLFLQRRAGDPREEDHYRTRASDWMSGDTKPGSKKNGKYQDLHLLQAYSNHIGIPYADYEAFLALKQPTEDLKATEWWTEYQKAFEALTTTKNHQKKTAFKALSADGQTAELAEMQSRHVLEVEEDKLYYFLLATHNGGDVLVIRSPADNKAIKKFLGYEWSNAKGSEGIKYLNAPAAPLPASYGNSDDETDDIPEITTAQLASIETPLYSPVDDEDDSKLAYYIRQSFLGTPYSLPASLQSFAHKARLVDMLDFSRKDFSKALSLTVKKRSEVVSKWELTKLGNLVETIGGLWTGKNPPFVSAKVLRNTNFVADGKLSFENVAELEVEKNQFSKRQLKKGDIIIEKSGGSETQAVGRVVLFEKEEQDFTFSNFTARLRKISDDVESGYLFLFLNEWYRQGETFPLQSGSSGIKNLDLNRYLEIKIPVPPKDVQAQIVAECRSVDDSVSTCRQEIENAREAIVQKIEETFGSEYPQKSIQQIAETNPSKSQIKEEDDEMLVSFIEMASVSNNGFIESSEDRQLKTVRKGSYTYFAENDIIVAKITPCMENGKCALAANLTNGIALGSSEFHVFRTQSEVLPSYLFHLLNRQSVREAAEKSMTGSSGHRRVPISFYENMRIPVPPLPIQQALIAEIEIEEARIAIAQQVITEAPAEKAAILRKHLE